MWKGGRVPAAPRCAHPCGAEEGRGEAWEAGEVTLSSGTGMGAYKYQAERGGRTPARPHPPPSS